MSRFGRNYVEFGHYTEDVFPAVGCRFIALNNGIDTGGQGSGNEVMCFLNLFNEFYSRDTSKKVRSVKRACAENGKFMGVHPAYGYKRDPLDKHHLVIDEETAPTVRGIFTMRASGMAFRRIALTLNQDGVTPPGTRHYQQMGRNDPRRVSQKWGSSIVRQIIQNEVYIGNMVQGRYGSLSYKSRKLVSKPKEEWIRVEGTHEPIISREVWETVVRIEESNIRKRTPSDGSGSIFTGLVFCADCGFRMRNYIGRFQRKDGSQGRYSSFICGNYARSGKTACTIHTIPEKVLRQIVLDDIRAKAGLAAYDYDRLTERIIRMKDRENLTLAASCEQELKTASARVRELERLMQNLYEDKCAGVIPQPVFQTLMRKYEEERARKAALIPELEQKVKARREGQRDADRWAAIIRRYTELSDLDETILLELVEKIEVGESEQRGSINVRNVKVYYRYVGNVDDASETEARTT